MLPFPLSCGRLTPLLRPPRALMLPPGDEAIRTTWSSCTGIWDLVSKMGETAVVVGSWRGRTAAHYCLWRLPCPGIRVQAAPIVTGKSPAWDCSLWLVRGMDPCM